VKRPNDDPGPQPPVPLRLGAAGGLQRCTLCFFNSLLAKRNPGNYAPITIGPHALGPARGSHLPGAPSPVPRLRRRDAHQLVHLPALHRGAHPRPPRLRLPSPASRACTRPRHHPPFGRLLGQMPRTTLPPPPRGPLEFPFFTPRNGAGPGGRRTGVPPNRPVTPPDRVAGRESVLPYRFGDGGPGFCGPPPSRRSSRS